MNSSRSDKSKEKPSALRLWLFRCITLLGVPLLLLVGVEFCLWLLPFGYKADFAVECGEKGDSVCDNSRFSWLFFSPPLARAPSPFSLLKTKPRDSYRIFVLGASAAMGDPEPSYGFSRMLEVMLERRYPEANFEVVNTAMAAINSHVVLTIAEDVSAFEPDLFIVYLGNNEVVGPYGAGTVFAPISPNRTLIRAGIKLKRTRTGQLLDSVVASREGSSEVPVWRGMEMFLEQQVRFSDPGMSSVYKHFRKNLDAILDQAEAVGAQVIISTVGTNLKDSAPFASQHRQDLKQAELDEWQRLYAAGISAAESGEQRRAVDAFQRAASIDNQYADLYFRLGASQLKTGDIRAATQSFVQARDHDVLRFRADSRINEIIRQVASDRPGAILLDTERLFFAASDTLPGDDLFYEHVHLNPQGNYLIAQQLRQLIDGLLPSSLQEKRSEAELDIEQTLNLLAFSRFDKRRIYTDLLARFERPPFTNQLDSKKRVRLLQQKLTSMQADMTEQSRQMDVQLYRQALAKRADDPWLNYNLGLLLKSSSPPNLLLEQFEKVLTRLPSHVGALDNLAATQLRMGRYEEALTNSRRSIALSPYNNRFAYDVQASALANLGRIGESIEVYQQLIKIEPAESVSTYNKIGRLHIQQQNYPAAVEMFQKAIASNDGSARERIPHIYYHLGYALKRNQQTEEATRAFDQAIAEYRLNLNQSPSSASLRRALGTVLAERGDFKAASEQFSRVRELDPESLVSHLNLIDTLQMQGDVEAAIKAARSSIKILEELGKTGEVAEVRERLAALGR